MKSDSLEKVDEYFIMANRGRVYARAVGNLEKILIERTLQFCFGNKSNAARLLGINRNTLHTKIKKLKINVEKFKL